MVRRAKNVRAALLQCGDTGGSGIRPGKELLSDIAQYEAQVLKDWGAPLAMVAIARPIAVAIRRTRWFLDIGGPWRRLR